MLMFMFDVLPSKRNILVVHPRLAGDNTGLEGPLEWVGQPRERWIIQIAELGKGVREF